MQRILIILLAALCVAACGRRRSTPSQETAVSASRPRVFLPAIAPAGLSPDEQRDYLRRHYWDRFDFTDTLFVSEADTVQMIEAFARYIAVLSDRPADSAPMDSLMRRASSSKPMLDYFAMLAGTVLHDPNSPLRNDEFYIPVLRAQLASPFYDEYERIAPQYDLEMAMQNRLGQPANDFRYTLASGASGTLYGLQAEYVLLFINNPGCAMCREIREAITSSPMLSLFAPKIKMLSSPTSSWISTLAPSSVPKVTAPFNMNFMLPVPEASLEAKEICSEISVAGISFSALVTL